MKKIMFLTGTRADYGKIKSLMAKIKEDEEFELYIFVTGMHMLSRYGSTWREIEKDGFKNVYHYINQNQSTSMDLALSNTIGGVSNYIAEINPDLIVVHGDRLEALAGAIVGAFNNIRVAHIEGGEVSGTIDESIRHAITKFAHIHLVSNEHSRERIIQLGEQSNSIFIIGSPDIDIMFSGNLPSISEVKKHYEINFDNYAILMYHPVTTEIHNLESKTKELIESLIASNKKYIIIYPNNDSGSEIILNKYAELVNNENFIIYPSIRFEYFLTLMKNADFVIGNSSAGIRETIVYGIPSIDLGNRQKGRYNISDSNLIYHVDENKKQILTAINSISKKQSFAQLDFGIGNSANRFVELLKKGYFWGVDIQKKFNDIG
jgi:UDP-N-acetylglucosamine 2-epimerase (hydrolysing)